MKQRYLLKRIFSALLAFCFLIVPNFSTTVVMAEESSYESMSDSEKQAYLEEKLDEANSKINTLGKQSKETKEYLDALDQKISYLNKQLAIIKSKVTSNEQKVDSLNKQYSKNEEDIASIGVEIENMTSEVSALETQFNESFSVYCQRLRAMYISGETSSVTFLLTSSDISDLLTRYEMVSRVAKQDSDMLSSIKSESTELTNAKDALNEKQISLARKQETLKETQADLISTNEDLTQNKAEMETKETSLATEQTQANTLLKKLNDETKQYTEYRDNTQEDLDAIDKAIAEAEKKYETTSKKKTTTTTTTTKKNNSNSGSDQNATTLTTTTTTTSSTGKYISLTYPVPSQTKITTTFHGYSGHSGCDFSCSTGSSVVAAESGTVIISADLTNADGTYRSYGRYIVIKHDKTTASGDAVYTLYAHLSVRNVSAGTYVNKGQLIAKSGSTGNSTGPHLHFELRTPSSSYSDCVDPANYLP